MLVAEPDDQSSVPKIHQAERGAQAVLYKLTSKCEGYKEQADSSVIKVIAVQI